MRLKVQPTYCSFAKVLSIAKELVLVFFSVSSVPIGCYFLWSSGSGYSSSRLGRNLVPWFGLGFF